MTFNPAAKVFARWKMDLSWDGAGNIDASHSVRAPGLHHHLSASSTLCRYAPAALQVFALPAVELAKNPRDWDAASVAPDIALLVCALFSSVPTLICCTTSLDACHAGGHCCVPGPNWH